MKSHQWDVKSMKNKRALMVQSKFEKEWWVSEKKVVENDPCNDRKFIFHGRMWFRTDCKNGIKIEIKGLDPVRL